MAAKAHAIFGDDDEDDRPKLSIKLPPKAAQTSTTSTASKVATPASATTQLKGVIRKAPTVDYSHLIDSAAPKFDSSKYKPVVEEEEAPVLVGEDSPAVAEPTYEIAFTEDDIQPEETSNVAALMGFGGFGNQKEEHRKLKQSLAFKEAISGSKRKTNDNEETPQMIHTGSQSPPLVIPKEKIEGRRRNKSQNEADDDHGQDDESNKGDDNDNDNEDDEEYNDDDEEGAIEAVDSVGIPISHEVTLDHGVKPVSALALDSAGARLVTGGYDSQIKFWDFAAMNAALKSFREIEPFEKHRIQSLDFSKTGDCILIGTGCAQAKIVDRDGTDILMTLKGDQYISDLATTHGHVATINNAIWHPHTRDHFLTCSSDSTIRLWDVNNFRKSLHVVKARTIRGQRAPVTSCAYNHTGTMVAAGCSDGTLRLYSMSHHGFKPTLQNDKAHEANNDITSVVFAHDNNTLYSRSCDSTVKVWDVRKLKTNVHTFDNLPCFYGMTDVGLSPDEKYIMTGTSINGEKSDAGHVVLFDSKSYEKVTQLSFSNQGIIKVLWHPRLNQIFASTSSGRVKILFDANKSFRGAMLCVGKSVRAVDPFDLGYQPDIFTPEVENVKKIRAAEGKQTTKRKKEAARQNPIKSAKPETPVNSTKGGKQGRVLGYSNTISQWAARNLVSYNPMGDEDPREALLKFAEKADNDPYWSAPAYKQTQPTILYDTTTPVDDNEDDGKVKRKKFDLNKKPI